MLRERKPLTEKEIKENTEELREFFEPEIPASGMLGRAEKIVDERMKKYGVPTESWTRIGRMWGAYLNIDDIPAEVCLQMMTMVKKIRERYEHDPDNWEDDAGYLDCAHRVFTDMLKKEGGGTPPEREPYKVECTLPGDNPKPWKSTSVLEP